MLKRNQVFCILLGITVFANVNAQSYFTVASASFSYASKTGVPKKNIYQNENATVTIPFTVQETNKLLIGLNYHRLSLRFNNTNSNQQHYYSSGLNLGYNIKHPNNSLLVMVLMRDNADYTTFQTCDFQLGGAFLYSKNKSDKLVLKAGLYANSEQFGLFLAPLLGLDWRITEKWRAYGLMPQFLNIENKVNARIRWGLAYQAPTSTYRLSNPVPDLYLQQNQVRAGLYGDFYFTKTIAAQVKVDYPLPAKYRIFTSEQRYDLNVWGIGIGGYRSQQPAPVVLLKNGIIIQFGLSYRVEL